MGDRPAGEEGWRPRVRVRTGHRQQCRRRNQTSSSATPDGCVVRCATVLKYITDVRVDIARLFRVPASTPYCVVLVACVRCIVNLRAVTGGACWLMGSAGSMSSMGSRSGSVSSSESYETTSLRAVRLHDVRKFMEESLVATYPAAPRTCS